MGFAGCNSLIGVFLGGRGLSGCGVCQGLLGGIYWLVGLLEGVCLLGFAGSGLLGHIY